MSTDDKKSVSEMTEEELEAEERKFDGRTVGASERNDRFAVPDTRLSEEEHDHLRDVAGEKDRRADKKPVEPMTDEELKKEDDRLWARLDGTRFPDRESVERLGKVREEYKGRKK